MRRRLLLFLVTIDFVLVCAFAYCWGGGLVQFLGQNLSLKFYNGVLNLYVPGVLGAQEELILWGGYEGAQRRQAHFIPDWMDGADTSAVRCLRCRFYETEHPTHRDFLGSLMGLGLTREKVGDILVSERWADVLVGSSVAEHLLREWRQAGRVPLKVEEIRPEEIRPPAEQVKLLRDTVASLRLDSVISAGFSVNRNAAAELIRSGKVEVKWMACDKPDAAVGQGDVLTVRGLGKCCLEEVGGQSRKGRTAVTMKRYL